MRKGNNEETTNKHVDAKRSSSKPSAAADMLRFVSSNFALVSAACALVGLVTSVVFTNGYLSVFNPQLIWFVEYTDILKVGLLALAFLSSGFSTVFFFIADDVGLAISKTRFWVTGGFITVAVGISFLWGGRWDYPELNYWAHAAILLSSYLLLWAVYIFPAYQQRPFRGIVFDIIAALVVTWVCGYAYGYYTRDIGGPSELTLKGQEEKMYVKIVLMTSHHTIFYTSCPVTGSTPEGRAVRR